MTTPDYTEPVGEWTTLTRDASERALEAAVAYVRRALDRTLKDRHLAPIRPTKVRTTVYLAGPTRDGYTVVLAETLALRLTNPPLLERLVLFKPLAWLEDHLRPRGRQSATGGQP